MLERYYGRLVLTPEHQAQLRELVAGEAERMTATSEKERARCNNVLTGLKKQERKLLSAHYKDRVSDELYNEEAARIQREREQVERIASRLDVDFSDVQRTLDIALELLNDVQWAFVASPPHVRRLINQAIFDKIELWDIDEI